MRQSKGKSRERSANRVFLIGVLLAFGSALMFSTKAIVVKLAYRYEIDSISLLTLRMLFALPFFLLIGWLEYKKAAETKNVIRNYWWKIAGLGICGYYVASLLDFWGLQYITASLERVILFIYPTIVLLISSIIFKQKILPIQMGALVLTYIGILIAFLENLNQDQEQIYMGGFFVLMAALTYAVYVVGSGQILQKMNSRIYNSIGMSFAAFAIILHNGLVNGWQLFDYPTIVYGFGLILAIIGTVLPSFMLTEGIRLIGANNAAIINGIGPITTIILAYLFLGERLGMIQWLGTLLVIGGVLLIALNKGSKDGS